MARRRGMSAEDLDAMIAEIAAQQAVIVRVCGRIAALSQAMGEDPAEIATSWVETGCRALDKAEFSVAEGHEAAVREEAKARYVDIVRIGMR